MERLEIESLLAAMGPEGILRGRPTMHRYQLEAAAKAPGDIRRRMLRFLATDGFAEAADLPAFDYHDVLPLVSADDDPGAAQALRFAVPDPELAEELWIEANRIKTWANQSIPRQETTGSAGAQPDDPDPGSAADFRRMWEVATDPMVVMRDLQAGNLSSDQVATLAVLYPALYAEMRQAASDAVAQTKARKGKRWEPSALKLQQLQTLRQEEGTDAELAATVQAMYQQEAQQEQAPAPRPRRTGGPPAEGLTPGERAAAGQ